MDMSENRDNNDSTCVVCFKNVDFYSIGECDHPVCYECSTRMRVLCLQNECPICRQELSKVVFTTTPEPFRKWKNQTFEDELFESKYKIGFTSQEIKTAYIKLLEHKCKKCKDKTFNTFEDLSDHMRRCHEVFFCDLCVKSLKIFTSERKCYTRKELAHHRRKGDLDDTSHRGHPLCEFCEQRYVDTDELYRHLRKEHLYCHLCDADGRNHYYSGHAALAHHFRQDHFLCEEGECADQHLTSVFRTDIDLKGHKASVHGRGMARAASRQARTLELQFNITPRITRVEATPELENVENIIYMESRPFIDTGSVEQFPTLGGPAAPAPLSMPGPSRMKIHGSGSLARTDKNFPALDGGTSMGVNISHRAQPSIAGSSTPKQSLSIKLQRPPTAASNFRVMPVMTSTERPAKHPTQPHDDFPYLCVPNDEHPSLGAATVQPPKISIITSQQLQATKQNTNCPRPNKAPSASSDAFPALTSSVTTPVTVPQWITVSKPKEKPKPSKVAPAPKTPTPSFNAVADFPQLTINTAKTKVVPSVNTPPKTNLMIHNGNNNTKSKKEKKKTANSMPLRNEDKQILELNKKTKKKTKENVSPTWERTESSIEQSTQSIHMDKSPTNSSNEDVVHFQESHNNNISKVMNGNIVMADMDKDFPCLKGGKKPPGFESVKTPVYQNAIHTIPPPPGFHNAANNLTFTNSAGQRFSAPLHTYIQPPQFDLRNVALVDEFASALGGRQAIQDFKQVSHAFREQTLSAEEFYEHCRKAMGDKLKTIFPELVALLPDISKQQALHLVHRSMGNEALPTCDSCGQVLSKQDLESHTSAHWPALPNARQS